MPSVVIAVTLPSGRFPCPPVVPLIISSFSCEEVGDTSSIGLSASDWLFTFLANNVRRREYPLSLPRGDVGDVGLGTLRWCRPGDLGPSCALLGIVVVSTVRVGVPGR